MTKFLQKKDLIYIGIIILIAIIVYFVFAKFIYCKQGNYALVTVDGDEYGTYLLAYDATVHINTEGGETNTLVIKDGSAYMKEAECPDHICIKQGRINKTGQTICCLPNKVLITIQGDEDGYDSVVM